MGAPSPDTAPAGWAPNCAVVSLRRLSAALGPCLNIVLSRLASLKLVKSAAADAGATRYLPHALAHRLVGRWLSLRNGLLILIQAFPDTATIVNLVPPSETEPAASAGFTNAMSRPSRLPPWTTLPDNRTLVADSAADLIAGYSWPSVGAAVPPAAGEPLGPEPPPEPAPQAVMSRALATTAAGTASARISFIDLPVSSDTRCRQQGAAVAAGHSPLLGTSEQPIQDQPRPLGHAYAREPEGRSCWTATEVGPESMSQVRVVPCLQGKAPIGKE